MADKALFNFGPATERDCILYGSARPGAAQQLCYDPTNKMPMSEVHKWIEYMKEQGIKRVISLLTACEVETFEPGFAELMKENFDYQHVNIKESAGGWPALQQLVKAGYEAKEKTLVHCWGGGGRAGAALAACVADVYQLQPGEAAEEINAVAAANNCRRKIEAAQVEALLKPSS